MAYTAEQLELKAYLEAQRDKTLAWVAEDPDNRFAATATTDLDHWAQWGITTVYQYQHHEAVTAVFEMHRDIWNFKPSWSDLEEMTLEELESELQKLHDYAREEEAREEEITDATVRAMMEAGAPDEATAKRWADEALKDEGWDAEDEDAANGWQYAA